MEGMINNLFYYTGSVVWIIVCICLAIVMIWYLCEVSFLIYKVIRCPFRMTKEGNFFKAKFQLLKWILVQAGSAHGTMKIVEDGRAYYFYGEDAEQKRTQEYHDKWEVDEG